MPGRALTISGRAPRASKGSGAQHIGSRDSPQPGKGAPPAPLAWQVESGKKSGKMQSGKSGPLEIRCGGIFGGLGFHDWDINIAEEFTSPSCDTKLALRC